MSSRLRKIARDAVKAAERGATDPSTDRAQVLIDRLHESGLLQGYAYTEIVSALLNVGARAIHEQSGLGAESSLRAISQSAGAMADVEAEHGWLANSWEKPN